jgi:subtilisin family serine protease
MPRRTCGSASPRVERRYREAVKKLRRALLGVGALALIAAASASAFTPTNQYYGKQWYLDQDHAFDAWATPPPLQQVKIAIIDSGVDCNLPDFQGQIVAKKSFVGGNPCSDSEGHGTIVAGEIAGELNSAGVVGLAFNSQLLVAKVVGPDGSIPLAAEADGIRWAVDNGARVINLSFGAVRDPRNPGLDTFSRLEAQAVAYAVSKRVTVVAAVGNSDEAPTSPWPYADWPAALPHVIGVAALTKSGNVPAFSDQDPTFVDVAAPGVDIFSTFPKGLTNDQPGCAPQGYTDCASGDYHRPEGTSFAAPQVSAAAAVLLGIDPTLTSSQISTLLERHADDVNAASGCSLCPVKRDKYSGWGQLDVAELRQAAARGRPVRAERHGLRGAPAVREEAVGHCNARLLGRPRRRLPGKARAWRAAQRRGAGALGWRVGRPEPLAREDGRPDTARGEDAAAVLPGEEGGQVLRQAARPRRSRPLPPGAQQELAQPPVDLY